MHEKRSSSGWAKVGALLAVAAMAVLTACGGGSAASGSTEDSELDLVAFSVPKAAYDDTQKAFANTPDGGGGFLEVLLRRERRSGKSGDLRTPCGLRQLLAQLRHDQAGRQFAGRSGLELRR